MHREQGYVYIRRLVYYIDFILECQGFYREKSAFFTRKFEKLGLEKWQTTIYRKRKGRSFERPQILAAAAVVVAATAAAVVAGAQQAVVATAAEQDEQDNDDPAAVAAPTIVTHREYLRIDF